MAIWRRVSFSSSPAVVFPLGVLERGRPEHAGKPATKVSPRPAPNLGDFVLYAQRSIHLTADEKVDGSVGVHAAALGVTGSQLFAGSKSQISKLLIAPSIEIENGVTSGGVLTNQLTRAGLSANAQPFPAVNMPALPFLPVPAAAGSTSVSVASGSTLILNPENMALSTSPRRAY